MVRWNISQWALFVALLVTQAVAVAHALDHDAINEPEQECIICLHSASGGKLAIPIQHDLTLPLAQMVHEAGPVSAFRDHQYGFGQTIRAPPVS